jgi:microcystin degradation protein MlrC
MPRIAIAMLSHEGNSFTPVPTDLAAFRAGAYAIGEAEARDAFAGSESEIGGALEFLEANPAWHGTFLRMAQAGPAGPLPRETFETILDAILPALRADRFDAVYLALHGAMLIEDEPRGDLETVRRVRAAIGQNTPLGASFDLHANMDPELAQLLTFAAGYKTHPHIDQRPTALRVLKTLARCVEDGLRPRGAIAPMGAILPSINMRTAEGPMAELEAFAAGLEAADPDLLDVSTFGGFTYGDTQSAGATAMAWHATNPDRAKTIAETHAAQMRTRRPRFFIRLPTPAQGIAAALDSGKFPAAVTDPGDNAGSGGIGDTPGLLRALLDANPQVPTVFAYITDPGLVERAQQVGIGGELTGTLGARLTNLYGPPIPFTATVRALTDGKFRNTGPMMRGVMSNFGPTALLSLEATPGGRNIRVIVTTLARSPHDPGLLALHGIALEDIALLCVKAKNHFRAAFLPLLTDIIDVDAPGPAALDIGAFQFQHAPKTLYPLNSK